MEDFFGGNQILKVASQEVETKVELQATSEVHKGENLKQTLEGDTFWRLDRELERHSLA